MKTEIKTSVRQIETAVEPEDRREIWLILPFLLGIFALKALVCYLEWRNGFLEYDADGFTRSLHAWEWGQQPRFEVDAWLPLQFWLNGTLLQIWPDIFREPRLVNLLASLLTTVNFFFIGRFLFGRWAGYGTALLAALFPWEIWFGLSGMSESLTQMFLSFGLVFFCRWLRTQNSRDLWLTSLGLFGATMLRYEAWFYSITYSAIVIIVSSSKFQVPSFTHRATLRAEFQNSKLKTQNSKLKTLAPLGLAFGFALVWVVASWVQKGSPIAFITLTSKINASLEETNANVSLVGRLLFYPKIFFNLLPPLTLLAIAGSLLLLWRPIGRARVYLTLIWGEFALFIVSTLPTNNIAPGSARYPVSNLMFLLPVVVYLFLCVAKWLGKVHWRSNVLQEGLGRGEIHWRSNFLQKSFFAVALRVGLALVFLALPLLFVQTILARPLDFPDSDMRQVALWFKNQTAAGKLPKDTVIPAHFPSPLSAAGADYSAIYGLSVLTNRPDGWRLAGSQAKGLRVISDIEGFEKTIRDDKPTVWINLKSAGDEERIRQLVTRYRDKVTYGSYEIYSRPLDKPLSVTPEVGRLDQQFVFTGEDFDPGERVFLWISYDATGAKSLPGIFADAQGRIRLEYRPSPEVPGTFSITARGEKSPRRAVAEVTIR